MRYVKFSMKKRWNSPHFGVLFLSDHLVRVKYVGGGVS